MEGNSRERWILRIPILAKRSFFVPLRMEAKQKEDAQVLCLWVSPQQEIIWIIETGNVCITLDKRPICSCLFINLL